MVVGGGAGAEGRGFETIKPLNNYHTANELIHCRFRLALATFTNDFSTSGNLCPRQNCSQRPPVEKTKRGFLLNRALCHSKDPMSKGTEPNELNFLTIGTQYAEKHK